MTRTSRGKHISDWEFYQSIGICPRCRKNKLYGSEKQCPGCSADMYAREGKPGRMERSVNGLCYFCGNPVKKGYKVCEKHYRMCVKNCTGREDV